MKNNNSFGPSIRLLASIVYGSLVVSEVLGYLFLLGAAFFRLLNHFYAEDFLIFVSVVVLSFLPFVFVLVLLSLLYTLVCGFAQMVDDTRDIRNHALGQNKPQASVVQEEPVKKESVKREPVKTVVVPQTPQKHETISVELQHDTIFCPYCGKSTFLDEEDRCEYCGREAHVKVVERKKAPMATLTPDDEPSEATCPPDTWFCKGCGAYVANDKIRCECGYKRK